MEASGYIPCIGGVGGVLCYRSIFWHRKGDRIFWYTRGTACLVKVAFVYTLYIYIYICIHMYVCVAVACHCFLRVAERINRPRCCFMDLRMLLAEKRLSSLVHGHCTNLAEVVCTFGNFQVVLQEDYRPNRPKHLWSLS